MSWKFIGSSSDDSFVISGIDIFKEQWEDTGEIAHVVDPLYGQSFNFTVWRINNNGKVLVFVAGEFSNNIFGIYQKN